MSSRRGICAVCQCDVALNNNQPIHHGPSGCDGSRFPHLGESMAGLLWAVDRAASRILTLQEELAVHWCRQGLRALVDVLEQWNVPLPTIELNLGPGVDPSWDRREDELRAQIVKEQSCLGRLTAVANEWRPGPPLPSRPIIHLEAEWRGRPGTAVPRCWSDAVRRPDGMILMEGDPCSVTCPDCQKFCR